jgi:hypothetical protein
LRRWASLIFVIWAIVYFSAGQLAYSLRRGYNLTELFDSYSEANAIRAGESYADRGFTYASGLPDDSYGTAFDNQGGKYDKHLCPSLPCIYLHNPPGPELLVGVMFKLCGKGDVPCLRYGPIGVGALCLVLFAWAIAKTMGIERCAVVFGLLWFAPMTANAMHILISISYMTSFMYLHMAALLFAFLKPIQDMRKTLVIFFLIGLLRGWTSYEDIFDTLFLGVPFWLMAATPRAAFRILVLTTVALGFGYALAILGHFFQVVHYLGSWRAAFHDFVLRASQRSQGHLEEWVPLLGRVRVLFVYWTQLLAEPQFFGFNYLAASAATFTALAGGTSIVLSRRSSVEWRPLATFKWSFLAAFVIPNIWLEVMRQHASVHGHFLPRHFFLVYVVGALLVALSLRSRQETSVDSVPAAIAA